MHVSDLIRITLVELEQMMASNPFAQEIGGLQYFILDGETIVAMMPSTKNRTSAVTLLIRDEGGRFVAAQLY